MKKGIIRFLPYASGSKSESERPYLEVEGEEAIRLHLEGDNPFSNDGLREFENADCKVEGKMDDVNDFFRVESIKKITGPDKD